MEGFIKAQVYVLISLTLTALIDSQSFEPITSLLKIFERNNIFKTVDSIFYIIIYFLKEKYNNFIILFFYSFAFIFRQSLLQSSLVHAKGWRVWGVRVRK